MDPAWIGVIGGAVGAAGGVAGSVLTTVLTQRGTRRDRDESYERETRDRWFEERRAVYLEMLELTSAAHTALGRAGNSQRSDTDEQLTTANKMISEMFRLEPRVALLGSFAVHRALVRFVNHAAAAEREMRGEEPFHIPRGTRKGTLEELIELSRADLGVGDWNAPDWYEAMKRHDRSSKKPLGQAQPRELPAVE